MAVHEYSINRMPVLLAKLWAAAALVLCGVFIGLRFGFVAGFIIALVGVSGLVLEKWKIREHVVVEVDLGIIRFSGSFGEVFFDLVELDKVVLSEDQDLPRVTGYRGLKVVRTVHSGVLFGASGWAEVIAQEIRMACPNLSVEVSKFPRHKFIHFGKGKS